MITFSPHYAFQFEVTRQEHPEVVQDLGFSIDEPGSHQLDDLEAKFRELYKAYDNYDKLLDQYPLVTVAP